MTIKFDSNNSPYIDVGGGHVIRLEQEPLDDAMKERAIVELRETSENVEAAVIGLRALLQDEKDITLPIDDDEFLIKFLRPCKFYPKSAFDRIKNYYKFRVKHKKIYEDLMPTTLKHVFDHDILHLQPKRDQFGRRILILEIGKKWKPSKCGIEDIFRSAQLCLEAALIEPMTQVNGVVCIFDFDGLSLTHVMQFSPGIAMMILEWIQDCIPLRLKGIHMVNNSYFFNMVFAIFKPFIREKLRKRIFFHNKDWKSLTSHIDKGSLRSNYGGTLDAPIVHGSEVGELLKLYSKRFEESNALGYNK